MPHKTNFRRATPLIEAIRDFLLGRKHTTALRFGPLQASRSPPPPVLPDGPSHKHSCNYYYMRDARGEVIPPLDVSKKLLHAPKETKSWRDMKKSLPTPGKMYGYDDHRFWEFYEKKC